MKEKKKRKRERKLRNQRAMRHKKRKRNCQVKPSFGLVRIKDTHVLENHVFIRNNEPNQMGAFVFEPFV